MENQQAKYLESVKRRKAAYDVKKTAATREKGLIIVNTGSGKGKTTAALGMAFRALGHEIKVGIIQFIKGAIPTGEVAFARQLPGRVEILPLGEGFTWETQNRQRDIEMSRTAWERAKQMLEDPSYNMVVLDELNIILKYEYLPLEEVLNALRNKREMLHVIITGRHAPPELIELADLATEMKLIKHPYQKGIKAQRGIEY